MKGGRVVGTEKRLNARWWRFTINNPTPQDYIDVDKLQWSKHCTELIAQEERGESGTLHIQGYVGFSSQKSANQMQNLLPRSSNANTESAKYKDYCCKQKTAVEGGRKWYWNKKEFEQNKELKELSTKRDAITENGHPLKTWQKEILDIIKTTPDFRTIYWYWSEKGGIGKTQFARYLKKQGVNLLYAGGKAENIKGTLASYKAKKNKVFDVILYAIPRETIALHVSYKALEEVKDAIFFSSRYESDDYFEDPPHVFVFANCEPITKKLSDDRWIIKNIDEDDDENELYFL